MLRLATRLTTARSMIASRPAAASLSSTNWFSTSHRQRNDELYEKSYTDEFDESDSIEVGKQKVTQPPEPSGSLTDNKETWPQSQPSKSSPSTTRSRSSRDNRSPFVGGSSMSSPWETGLFSPRSLFGGGSVGFEDMFPRDLFPSMKRRRNELLSMLDRDWMEDPDMSLIRSSPGYDIKETDKNYEIAVDVPQGMKAKDLTVDMEDEGTCLHITGHRETEEDGARVRRYFEKSFMIGDDIDADHITANLSNGRLVVKAPKVPQEEPQKRPGITITEDPQDMASPSTLSGETGVHEIPVETSGDSTTTDSGTSTEETTGGVAVNTMERPTGQSEGRENVGDSTGIAYGSPRSPEDNRKSEIEHENTRYAMSDHKSETGGPSREYPACNG